MNPKIHLTILALGVALFACEPRQKLPVERPTSLKADEFRVRYVVPLTTGRFNGERDILDSTLLHEVNIAALQPVIQTLAQDAMEGKIRTCEEGVLNPESATRTFLPKQLAELRTRRPDIHAAEMSSSMEVSFSGKSDSNGVTLHVHHLDLVVIDLVGSTPDKRLASILAPELTRYIVVDRGRNQNLVDYLEMARYARYPTQLETADDTVYFKNFADAQAAEASILAGKVFEVVGK